MSEIKEVNTKDKYLDNLFKNVTERSKNLSNRMLRINKNIEKFFDEAQKSKKRKREQNTIDNESKTKNKQAGIEVQLKNRKSMFVERFEELKRSVEKIEAKGEEYPTQEEIKEPIQRMYMELINNRKSQLIREKASYQTLSKKAFQRIKEKMEELNNLLFSIEFNKDFEQLGVLADFALQNKTENKDSYNLKEFIDKSKSGVEFINNNLVKILTEFDSKNDQESFEYSKEKDTINGESSL